LENEVNIREKAEEVIERAIRPLLRSHNGDIHIRDIDNGIIRLVFTGTCRTCPLAQLTTEELVKKVLKTELGKAIKDITLVNETDDELLRFAKKLLSKK
jgi:Fe-S cluster biogenesis protein NfuA